MYSRREFGTFLLASLPAAALAAKSSSLIKGVMIGAQSYSFRDRSFDDMIKGMNEVGLSYVELWDGHAEPQKDSGETEEAYRERIRNWRLTVPLSHFEEIRKKLDAASITLYAYNYSFREDFTDQEIARGFEIVKAMGIDKITASSNVSTARRVDSFASKAKIYVGMHNHSNIKPNEFARPEDFAAAMKGTSKYIGINLDIGHFWAANYDPVEFLEKHHDRIVTLHIKDRKKNQGDNYPFGQGDTPIKEVLRLLEEKKYKIPANIEYEYEGSDTVAEVKKCFDYCKQALA